MTMRRAAVMVLAVWSLCLPGRLDAAEAQVGEANTLWVVPERQLAWVEPLYARRKDGGRLYQLDGLVVQRDLGESLKYAIAYLSEHPEDAPGWDRLWQTHDLYFWWPDPEQPRGGTSAGVAFAVAAYSAMLDRPVRRDVAFTGGIGPDGAVLPIGGLPLKIPAAVAAGIKTLCLPAAGAPEIGTLPFETARKIRLVTLRVAGEAFFEAFGLAGPEASRYDRVTTLWLDAREAIARRQPVAARLALDELCEKAPNDLSAERLRRSYQSVDMRAAAQNLFADAQQYDRDGLPDVALQTARRAFSYADEPTRRKHAALVERLERESLPPTSRALLDRALERAAAGEPAEAYRLLTELSAREPGHPILHRLEPQRLAYSAVAKLEAAVAGRPDDLTMRDALAQAYLAAAAPLRAVDVYGELRQRQPDEPRWVMGQAAGWAAAGRAELAAGLLRETQPRWPDAVAAATRDLRLELDPPALTVDQVERPGNVVRARVTATDAAGPAVVEAFLGQRPLARAPGPHLLLHADLGRVAPGPASLRLVATDPLGNLSELELDLDGAAAPPACVGASGGLAGAPATVTAQPGERWLVGPGTRLRCDAADWFRLPVDRLTLDREVITVPPFSAIWTAPTEPGPQTVALTVAGEVTQPPQELHAEVAAAPPVRWIAPVDGTNVRGTVPIQIVAETATAVQLWIDGVFWQAAPAGQALLWQTSPWPAGEHRLTAIVERRDGRRACSGEIVVRVPPPSTVMRLDDAPAWIAPVSLTGLLAQASEPHPAVTPVMARDAAWFGAAPDAWVPLRLPAPSELAIRLPRPAPNTGRIELPPGQAVAFDEPPEPALLGPGPVVPGPLATFAWTPPGPGTWQLGELALSCTPGAALALTGPAEALRLRAPVRFELAVPPAAEDGPLSLLAGDAAWCTWSRAPAAVWLDPELMEPGSYPLRLVARRGDGRTVVSPPVLVEVE